MSLTIKKRNCKINPSDNQIIIDVTSKSKDPTFVKFSPFYPHMDIPVPGTNILTASVEGAWQGLKVFEKEGIDLNKMKNTTMKNIKRNWSVRRGHILGHKFNDDMVDYLTARKMIYIPMYEYVLQNKLTNEVALIKGLVEEGNHVILLDYDTNENVENTDKPLSHAGLIKKYVMS